MSTTISDCTQTTLRLATAAMGTRFELVLVGEDVRGLRAAGEEALDEIEYWDRRLSLFRRDSEVAHINRNAHQGFVRVDEELWDLLCRCAELVRASQGAFDPSLGAQMAANGLYAASTPCIPARVDAGATTRSPWEHVELDHERRALRFARPDLALDFGAIGKGYALDAAAEVLRDAGVACALLHGGTSTVVALAAPPDMEGWTIAIDAADGSRPDVCLRDAALSVSTQKPATERAGHVVDPRKASSASAIETAIVVAPTATQADAWSTALLAGANADRQPAGLEWAYLPSTARMWRHAPNPLQTLRIPASNAS